MSNSIVNEIRLGDCIEGMKGLLSNSVHLIVADPPYNLKKGYANDNQDWMKYHDWTNQWFSECRRILKSNGSIYVFMGTEFIARLFLIMQYSMYFRNWIVWHYTQGVGKTRGFSPRHEDILYFTMDKEDYAFGLSSIRQPQKFARSINNPLGANPGDVWSIPHVHHNKSQRTGHPTQKPEAVIERIIQASSFPGDLVVDPFSGSGTTASVCKNTLRNFIGWEINPQFHKNSRLRLIVDAQHPR